MPQKSQKPKNLVPPKRLESGNIRKWGLGGHKQWYLSFQNPLRNRCAELCQNQESNLKIAYFRPQNIWISRLFPQIFCFVLNNLKPTFFNEKMTLGQNLIFYSNILHEKWHILKENQIYHETKMSKITHSE